MVRKMWISGHLGGVVAQMSYKDFELMWDKY